MTPTAPDPQTLASAFDALVKSAADAVRQWTYDPPAEAPLSIRVTFAFLSSWHAPSDCARRLVVSRASVPAPGTGHSSHALHHRLRRHRLRVGRAPAMGQRCDSRGRRLSRRRRRRHVNPQYPAAAQTARVQGVVILEAHRRRGQGHQRARPAIGSAARSGGTRRRHAVGVHADSVEWPAGAR